MKTYICQIYISMNLSQRKYVCEYNHMEFIPAKIKWFQSDPWPVKLYKLLTGKSPLNKNTLLTVQSSKQHPSLNWKPVYRKLTWHPLSFLNNPSNKPLNAPTNKNPS